MSELLTVETVTFSKELERALSEISKNAGKPKPKHKSKLDDSDVSGLGEWYKEEDIDEEEIDEPIKEETIPTPTHPIQYSVAYLKECLVWELNTIIRLDESNDIHETPKHNKERALGMVEYCAYSGKLPKPDKGFPQPSDKIDKW